MTTEPASGRHNRGGRIWAGAVVILLLLSVECWMLGCVAADFQRAGLKHPDPAPPHTGIQIAFR